MNYSYFISVLLDTSKRFILYIYDLMFEKFRSIWSNKHLKILFFDKSAKLNVFDKFTIDQLKNTLFVRT